ncbi:unnamed protein product, partial [marine sediment metagenome]
MGLKSGLFNDDVDLTAVGAVNAALGAGVRGGFSVPAVADLMCPNELGMKIIGLMGADETEVDDWGYLTIAGNPRIHSFISAEFTATEVLGNWTSMFHGGGIPVAPYTILNCAGNSCGAGAEQHAVSVIVDSPGVTTFDWKQPSYFDEIMSVEMTTAAAVADTQSGHNDICGRLVAYTSAQVAIPADPTVEVGILSIHPHPGAGYSGVGISDPIGNANLDFPGSATKLSHYDLVEIFGGCPTRPANTPLTMY